MFGAIIFIPLFLQLVYGVSPTSSGLRMLPLMAGLLAASILGGRTISRIGRYKPFPIAGSAVTTVGMFLLSRLEVDTPPWLASVYMLVVGVGIGLVMQVLVLAVQNTAPPKDIGVATSAATFFRSMGGSLGVALFGAIFASRLADELAQFPPEIASRFSGGLNISPDEVHAPARRGAAGLPERVRRGALPRVPGRRRADRDRVRAGLVPARGAAARRGRPARRTRRRGSDRGRHRRRGDHRGRTVAATFRFAAPALSTTSTFTARRAALRPAALSRTVMRRVPEPRP